MSAPGQKLCRHCVHAVWQMSPSCKQIKQRTPGECGEFKELSQHALQTATAPPVQILAFRRHIWPTTNAKACPSYKRKGGAA